MNSQQNLLQERSDLHLCKKLLQTKVNTISKGEVTIWITVDSELKREFEYVFIAIS